MLREYGVWRRSGREGSSYQIIPKGAHLAICITDLHYALVCASRLGFYGWEPRCINTTRNVITATRASSNQNHCRMGLKFLVAQVPEETSLRFPSSAVPAATKRLFQRSMRPTGTPRSSLTASADSPFNKRSTAAVFSWLENRACRWDSERT